MRRFRVAAVLGALSVAAVTGGAAVLLQGAGTPEPPGETVAAAPKPSPSPQETRTTAQPRRLAVPRTTGTTTAATREAAVLSPNTVRLPEGGTATLVRRELTPDGTLPIPDGLGEATWWGAKLGASRGVALLSGHVNWAGRTGPFQELWRDRRGQRVTVVDAGGGRWVYRITELLTLHKTELPAHAQRLFSQRGPHRLVLVTCGGDYVGGTDGYEDNRIAVAELVTRP